MYILSIPFVFECFYRSFLPRIDIPRICFFNVWGNNVLFGRLSAFVGEWCWMLQISFALQVRFVRNATVGAKRQQEQQTS